MDMLEWNNLVLTYIKLLKPTIIMFMLGYISRRVNLTKRLNIHWG